MKEYLAEIRSFAKQLKQCAKWHNSSKSISSLRTGTENSKDYVYEFFCYLAILDDLSTNYNLKYNDGIGNKKGKFPKTPVAKNGYPFFYIEHKLTGKKYQVCAGTQAQTAISKDRAPDISFQIENADLARPKLGEVRMIFDAKRKRVATKKQKLGIGQYSMFHTMIHEFQLTDAHKEDIEFNQFKDFVGNCLITNKEAFSRITSDNEFHKLKEVEFFDDNLDVSKINVIG